MPPAIAAFINFSFAEYNPKLSDATLGTRVAYVKFMARTLKKEQEGDEVKIVNEKDSLSRTASATGAKSTPIKSIMVS